MTTKFDWTISLFLLVLLTYYTITIASSQESHPLHSSSFLLWVLFMFLDAAYGHFFHLALLVPARYLAACLPGAKIPPLQNENELLQQEAESNDPSIIWPSVRILEQLPTDWLPDQGVKKVHSDSSSRGDDAPKKNSNQTYKKRRAKIAAQEQLQDIKSSIRSPQSLSQPYYLNHVRGSTRLRQASQRVAAAMGTLCATYLLCDPSLASSSSSSSSSSSTFLKFQDVGLQIISFHRVLHDIIFGIFVGSIIVTVIFGVEVYMGWVRIVGYWEKVVPDEKFGLNLLWDVLFQVGVSVNEELMLRGWMFSLGCRGLLPTATQWIMNPSHAATFAILLSITLQSTLFALLHLHSPGSTPISLLNLFIGGIAASWNVMAAGGTIWLGIGWHFGWNIMMGHILGRSTSGIPMSCAVVSVIPRPFRKDRYVNVANYHGGTFGPEQGILAPMAYMLGMGLVYFFKGSGDFELWRGKSNGNRIIMASISPMPVGGITTRTVSADPGLLSNEELLAEQTGNQRQLLLKLIKRDTSPQARISIIFKRTKKFINWFLDRAQIKISYNDVMMVVTTYILFGHDVKILCFPPSADIGFALLVQFSFVLFVLEMVLHFFAKSDFSKGPFDITGYAFSFYFWLDLLVILSIVPDVDWLASLIGIRGTIFDSPANAAFNAGRIGAKASRVIRMIPLIRLVKLGKVTFQRSRVNKKMTTLRKLIESGNFSPEEIQQYVEKSSARRQSKIGAEISDIITRRVIIGVFLMLCVVPFLTYSSPVDDEKEATMFLHEINVRAGLNCDYLGRATHSFRSILDELGGSQNQPFLLALAVSPPRCEETVRINFSIDEFIRGIRSQAIRTISTDASTLDGEVYFVSASFNLKPYMEQQAKVGICLIVFVLVMFAMLSIQITGDAQRLVLAPIENMMAIVNMVAEDPLKDFDFKSMPTNGDYETHVVQSAIEKITALLRIGFGVAGAEIISSNIALDGGGSARLNPMIPGKRVYALFGFCNILSFDRCTEQLEDEIMTFVNSVARIVHDQVTRWGGTCNKNLGDSFLMVWRIGDENALADYRGIGRRNSERTNETRSTGRRNSERSTNSDNCEIEQTIVKKTVHRDAIDLCRIPGLDFLSDKALIGFLKVIIEVNRDVQLLAYRCDERLSIGYGDGFSLRMGFGLHAGWAIEGAVGSLQKVDATYLSPHVNMAARMEVATKQFGVSILMTRSFYKLLSEPAQNHCRKVDVVTVKGSNVPMSIYTYDTFQNQVFPQLRAPKFSNLTLQEVLTRQAEKYDATTWTSDPDLVQLRCLVTPLFLKTFDKGLKNYLGGHWEEAREIFEKADKLMASNDVGGDGPSQAIMKYMNAHNWKCPSSWTGHRPLTSK